VRANSKDYKKLFLSDAPMIDLRAPCEFAKGSFPNAISLPLMSDIERQKIGTCYKRDGQEAAIKLGHQLVKGKVKEERLAGWKEFINQHPDTGYIYCFRGGLRSHTVQKWLNDEGINYPLVETGYKALRHYLIETTERLTQDYPFYIIAGLTGSAKTTLLLEQNNYLDLEGLANHRGSSFGRQISPQPSQISFENLLAIEMLKLEAQSAKYLVLEDEGRLIGSRSTPLCFFNKMKQSPLVMLQESFEFRMQHIHQEYVGLMTQNFISENNNSNEEKSFEEFSEYLLSSIDKIKKRLGSEAHLSMRKKILLALEVQKKSGDQSQHFAWIKQLLADYYDPMYHFQLKNKMERVVFQGNRAEVSEYLSSINQ
jgi:tRNA 2-selenouridine synthase